MIRISHRIFEVFIVIFAIIGLTLTIGYVAVRLKLTNVPGIIDEQSRNFIRNGQEKGNYETFPLAHTKEWIAFRLAVAKDKLVIEEVSKETGVSERLLVSLLVPEQMRLFNSNRALFKEIFAPLAVLGNQSQFSWGIFGIKDETARAIEKHLKDKDSPFYLGKNFETILSFTTNDHDQERFQRIIDEKNHKYSYLYTALYIREVEKQWEKAGFPIADKPEIIATLFNIGFENSKPNSTPRSGGAPIVINDTTWSFGSLAASFYYSDEMIELFPQK